MDHSEGVRRFERREDLRRVLARGRHVESLPALHGPGERLALEQLHHQVRDALGRAIDVDDLNDVRASDLCRNARFLEEAFCDARASREVRMENLDRNARPQRQVLGLVNGPHAAVAEQAQKLVLPGDDLADLEHVPAFSTDRPGATGLQRARELRQQPGGAGLRRLDAPPSARCG